MEESVTRRGFLMNVSALGASVVSTALITGIIGEVRAQVRSSDSSAATGLPRIQLMMSSGTLPSVGKDRMDMLRYRESGIPRLTGQQLLAPLPEIASIARVTVDNGNPWDNANHDALRKLSLRVNDLLRSSEVDGLIFIQGTNSLEETAYFLSLTVHSDKPIVVTGAQRPYNALSTDGPINLLDAVRAAASPETRGKGAVVVFNGEINAARDVTKTNTYHLQTFRTRDMGIIGYADADKIEYYRTPHRRHTIKSEFNLEGVQNMPYVDIAYIHTGTRPGLAKAMVQLGAKGIVLAGSGAGSPGNLDKEIADIVKTRSAVVVQSSRVGEGRVVRHNNWYWPGMVVADTLIPQKAALLLALALIKTSDPDEIQRIFDEY
jgi:L-asparaginase